MLDPVLIQGVVAVLVKLSWALARRFLRFYLLIGSLSKD